MTAAEERVAECERELKLARNALQAARTAVDTWSTALIEAREARTSDDYPSASDTLKAYASRRDAQYAAYERRKADAHEAMTAEERAAFTRRGYCTCPVCRAGA